jgi:hypothetical protein
MHFVPFGGLSEYMMTKLMHLTKHNLLVPLHGNNYVDYDDLKSKLAHYIWNFWRKCQNTNQIPMKSI